MFIFSDSHSRGMSNILQDNLNKDYYKVIATVMPWAGVETILNFVIKSSKTRITHEDYVIIFGDADIILSRNFTIRKTATTLSPNKLYINCF